jgi:hypothetical protein
MMNRLIGIEWPAKYLRHDKSMLQARCLATREMAEFGRYCNDVVAVMDMSIAGRWAQRLLGPNVAVGHATTVVRRTELPRIDRSLAALHLAGARGAAA